MTRPRRLWPLVTLGLLLALAPAAGARYYELNASGRGAHGFTLRLRHATVFDFPGRGPNGVDSQAIYRDPGSVLLSRTVKGQTLTRRLEAAKGAKVTAASGLKHARVRLSFGSRGSVDLRFTPTTQLKGMGPDNCNASQLHGRRGVFRGTFKVKLGGGFHTLRRTTFRGALAVDSTGDDCSDPVVMGGDTHLAVKDAGVHALFYDTGTGIGRLTLPGRRGRGWRLHDEIAADARNTFTRVITTDNLGHPTGASAHVKASGPFLTGTLDYRPRPGVDLTNDEGFFDAPGPVTGSLAVAAHALGRAGVTMRPRTGRLTQGCEQCI